MGKDAGPWRACTDAALLNGISVDNPGAWAEFHQRFAPGLLRLAERLGVPTADAEEMVDDLMLNAATLFTTKPSRRPRHLSAYLETALRNRVRNWLRDTERRAFHVAEEPLDPDRAGASTGSTSSEASLRASRGSPDNFPLPLGLRRLVSALDEGLTNEERLLLEWVSNMIPQREIAAWLGTTHDAAGRRIRRLTERLLEAAELYVLKLSDADWGELEPFFRRAVANGSQRVAAWQARVGAARGLRRGIQSEKRDP